MKRRQFLKTLPIAAAGVTGFPTIVSATALGRQGAVAPSNRIVMAGLGFGMMGIPNMEAFLGKDEVQWVAGCDLDKNHLAEAKGIVDKTLGNTDCAAYTDLRELLARPDIDAVSIAVPDHWHAFLSISCARAGWDIYAEKPFSPSLRDGRAMCDRVPRYGRILH